MGTRLIFTAVALALGFSAAAAWSDPVVPDGYMVERYATGIGAANALAIGPDGLLYITDYSNGHLLRRTEAGTLEVVASGLQWANGLAILPDGRKFVTANDYYVYEIDGYGNVTQLAGGISYHTSVAAKGESLYVTSSGDNRIVKVPVNGEPPTNELSGVVNPFGISFDAVGNMYFISHAAGQLYTYNFNDQPQLIVSLAPYSGTYTGFGFDGQLFWASYGDASLYRLRPDGTPEVFATGFSGGASPPAIGPNGIVAQDANAILVADGHDVWRISRRPEAAGVLQERGMQVKQLRDGEWAVGCTIQYSGVNGSHEHRVSLDVVGPGISLGPVEATLSPASRHAMIQEAGIQSAKYVLTPTQLWLERTVYLDTAPARGDLYYCEGAGRDVTDGTYLRTTHMEDSSH